MARPSKVHPVGARVRHGGEQWFEASITGTAVVTGHEWHGDHLEYLVRRDKPFFEGMSVDTQWAFYHTYLAEQQPEEVQ